MENQKLVVFDLDNTFWNGTLAEKADVALRPGVENTIRQLVARGIMVSIASANQYAHARNKLEALGLWRWFVFPQINFRSKADNVATIITHAHLRPASVTFIDDEPRHRAAVQDRFPA